MCDIDIRFCAPEHNNCMNNGTCIQKADGSFGCVCKPYYNGTFCEIKEDLCQNETCSNNGACVDLSDKTRCKCFYMYEGEKCEDQSKELKVIKAIISTASIIAIITIVLLAVLIVSLDVSKLFGCAKSVGRVGRRRLNVYDKTRKKNKNDLVYKP